MTLFKDGISAQQCSGYLQVSVTLESNALYRIYNFLFDRKGAAIPVSAQGSGCWRHNFAMNHHVCLRQLMHFPIIHLVLYGMARVS